MVGDRKFASSIQRRLGDVGMNANCWRIKQSRKWPLIEKHSQTLPIREIASLTATEPPCRASYGTQQAV
jgi:hypothetical protein